MPDKTLVRGEDIPDGYYHLVCEIIVKHVGGEYLLMQRDLKKNLGGMWEATAGGSALKGEDSLRCAYRELEEETGIKAKDLIEVGRVVHHRHKSLYVEYLCITDIDKDSIILQEGETKAFKWISLEELYNMDRNVLATQRILNFIY